MPDDVGQALTMKQHRDDPNNERIARAIIMSNTNPTQRASLLWLGDLERAIVKALDLKDTGAHGQSPGRTET